MNPLAHSTAMPILSMTDKSLKKIQRLFFRSSGIYIADSKDQLIVNRLQSHMMSLGFNDFDLYANHLEQAHNHRDRLAAVDLLTTNETYFFREPEHFHNLKDFILPSMNNKPLRVWCAAASSGEEPFSIAMVLAEKRGYDTWELIASDISTRMLEKANTALYPMQRLDNMPAEYLKKFCRKGVGNYEGMFRVREELRNAVQFRQHNLLDAADHLGMFDIIFVRNVMIYFDTPVKNLVMRNLCRQLKPNGWLITSHAESLIGNQFPLKIERPSVYRKTEAV